MRVQRRCCLVRAVVRAGSPWPGSIWTLCLSLSGAQSMWYSYTVQYDTFPIPSRPRSRPRRRSEGGLAAAGELEITESEAEEGIGSTQANARTNSRPTEIRSSSSKFPYRYHDLRRQLSHFQVLLLHERQLRGPGAGKVRAPERLNLRISWCTRSCGLSLAREQTITRGRYFSYVTITQTACSKGLLHVFASHPWSPAYMLSAPFTTATSCGPDESL